MGIQIPENLGIKMVKWCCVGNILYYSHDLKIGPEFRHFKVILVKKNLVSYILVSEYQINIQISLPFEYQTRICLVFRSVLWQNEYLISYC